jgi:hypothetical protein
MSTDLTPSRVEQQAPTGHAVLRVPWRAVLPLAVVLTGTSLFWVGALRVAVGHISRNQTPFESWVRESVLSTPLFVLAVLGALTLALHRFGASPRGAKQVWSTIGLVTAATTTAGMVVLAASTYYDYRLELDGERLMGAMRQSCTGTCADLAEAATFRLQLQAMGWGTALILVTNLVLVAWAVAALGGRLRIGTDRPEGTFRVDARTVLVAGLVGGAAIHAAVVPEHLEEWAAAGSFFVLLVLAELVVAGWLCFGARVPALLAAAAVSGGPLLVWLWSRSSGLPFGPEPGAPEPVGMADIAASLLEVLTLVLAVVLLRRVMHEGRARTPERSPAPNGARLALVAVVAVTAIGLAGTPLSWFGVQVEGSSHASQDAESS